LSIYAATFPCSGPPARRNMSEKKEDMTIRVNIFYPNTEGGWFDLEYYLNTHMPMAIEKLVSPLKGVSVEHGVSGVQPGTKPANIVMCNYTFDSSETFLAAFMPHAQALDMPNYTVQVLLAKKAFLELKTCYFGAAPFSANGAVKNFPNQEGIRW
jgi:uncharacterized protein (TIGR02118 family)